MAKTIYDHMKEVLDEIEKIKKQLIKEHQDDNVELDTYLSELDLFVVEFKEKLEEAKKAGIDGKIASEYYSSLNTDDDTPLTKTELNELAVLMGMKSKQVQEQLDKINIQTLDNKKHKRKSDILSMDETSNSDYGRKNTDITNEIKDQHTNTTKQKRKQVEQTLKKQEIEANKQVQFDQLDAMYQEMFLKPQLTDEELQAMSDFYGVSIEDVISQWEQRCLSEKEYKKHQKKRHKKSLFQRNK